MDTKKEIRKKVFAARKQRTDAWVEEMSKAIHSESGGSSCF